MEQPVLNFENKIKKNIGKMPDIPHKNSFANDEFTIPIFFRIRTFSSFKPKRS